MQVVNNYDWYGGMQLLTFLRDVGKLARMGTMLNKDSVKSRLDSESGMSYTEFTYQLLQGYDFVHLCREEGVRVQIGGSDQWGNITAGTDLVRKILGDEAPQCFGLTFPLLVRMYCSLFAPCFACTCQRHVPSNRARGVTLASASVGGRRRQEVWQVRGRRDLAVAGEAITIQILSVPLQDDGCRRHPLPAHADLPAAGADRGAGGDHDERRGQAQHRAAAAGRGGHALRAWRGGRRGANMPVACAAFEALRAMGMGRHSSEAWACSRATDQARLCERRQR